MHYIDIVLWTNILKYLFSKGSKQNLQAGRAILLTQEHKRWERCFKQFKSVSNLLIWALVKTARRWEWEKGVQTQHRTSINYISLLTVWDIVSFIFVFVCEQEFPIQPEDYILNCLEINAPALKFLLDTKKDRIN